MERSNLLKERVDLLKKSLMRLTQEVRHSKVLAFSLK